MYTYFVTMFHESRRYDTAKCWYVGAAFAHPDAIRPLSGPPSSGGLFAYRSGAALCHDLPVFESGVSGVKPAAQTKSGASSCMIGFEK